MGRSAMDAVENPGRERILQRIRNALSASTPAAAGSEAEIFPLIPDEITRFSSECAANHTELVLTGNELQAAHAVAKVLSETPEGEIFMQDAPSLRRLAETCSLQRTILWSNAGGPTENAQASITLAEALVAQTGSILVSSACGGRSATVAAPVHVVVAWRSQLVPDLKTLFSRVSRDERIMKNSMLCLTTGSSRTGDIEKILVLGAHGPRRLVVVLQSD